MRSRPARLSWPTANDRARRFDYVIVGGGSAGCVLAARLSENPFVTRLPARGRAGRQERADPLPGRARAARQEPAPRTGRFETVPQPGLNGRRGYQPRGKVLGGSSSVNAMIYLRGQPRGLRRLGARRATTAGAGPTCCRTSSAPSTTSAAPTRCHGSGGPLNVMDLRSPHRFGPVFVEAAQQAGLPAQPPTSTARARKASASTR